MATPFRGRISHDSDAAHQLSKSIILKHLTEAQRLKIKESLQLTYGVEFSHVAEDPCVLNGSEVLSRGRIDFKADFQQSGFAPFEINVSFEYYFDEGVVIIITDAVEGDSSAVNDIQSVVSNVLIGV